MTYMCKFGTFCLTYPLKFAIFDINLYKFGTNYLGKIGSCGMVYLGKFGITYLSKFWKFVMTYLCKFGTFVLYIHLSLVYLIL